MVIYLHGNCGCRLDATEILREVLLTGIYASQHTKAKSKNETSVFELQNWAEGGVETICTLETYWDLFKLVGGGGCAI